MERRKDTRTGQAEKQGLAKFREYAVEQIHEQVRRQAVELVVGLMQEEVALLCGQAFAHKGDRLAHRAGSEKGSIALFGQRTAVRRPRVRRDGKEVRLDRYTQFSSMDNLGEKVFKMMIHGISTRGYDECLEKTAADLGLSRSSVSRQFIKQSRECLNQINTRKFSDQVFWALIIDGIHIGGDVLVVAMGVDLAGEKHFLGVSQGSTENAIVVSECLSRIAERKIQFTDKIVAVLDGAKALKKGVETHFGQRVAIQRCLNHKVRNVEAKLAKKYHFELKERIRQAYGCNDYADARPEFDKIRDWLNQINVNAAESMEEGLEELLTLHKINMPPSLRKSFYTTNLIESAFADPRFKMRRVKRWIKQGDMIKRWAGAALIAQEIKFRRVRNFHLIDCFIEEYSSGKENMLDKRRTA